MLIYDHELDQGETAGAFSYIKRKIHHLEEEHEALGAELRALKIIQAGLALQLCPECFGKKKVRIQDGIDESHIVTCPTCKGFGGHPGTISPQENS